MSKRVKLYTKLPNKIRNINKISLLQGELQIPLLRKALELPNSLVVVLNIEYYDQSILYSGVPA